MLVSLRSLRLGASGNYRLLSLFPRQNRRKYEVARKEIGNGHLCSAAELSDFECDEVHEDDKVTQKDTALHLALSQLASDFGRESMMSYERFFRTRRAAVISTGSLKLDLALGLGGLPKGRMIEVYGQEASGKTTLALHIIKEAQKLGGYCAYLDVENAMDPSLAASIGVDTEKLLISRPDSAENLLSVVDTLTKSGSVDVIVVDSVAALAPQCELDVPLIGGKEDVRSRLMTKALRKIHYSLCNSSAIIVFINQIRRSGHALGHMEEVTCGGNTLKFYAAVRLKMIRTGLVKTDETISGLRVCVQVVKNKLAAGVNKAELGIRFGKGFDLENEVLELACEHGVIGNEGRSYFIEGEVLNNKKMAEIYLRENSRILDHIVMLLRQKLFSRKQ